jgi:hypothetical protein
MHYWRIKMKNRKFKLFLLLLHHEGFFSNNRNEVKSLVLLFFVLLILERKKQIISMTSIHICLWKQCDSVSFHIISFSFSILNRIVTAVDHFDFIHDVRYLTIYLHIDYLTIVYLFSCAYISHRLKHLITDDFQ